MLPIISLSFLHMLVKFTEEDRKKEEVIIEEEKKHVIDEQLIKEAIENYKKEQESNKIEASDLVGETSRLRLSEDDLKKLEEILLNPPPPNEELKRAAKEYMDKVDDKPWKGVSQEVWDRMAEIEKQRESIHGPILPEDVPTGALANSEYRNSDFEDDDWGGLTNEELIGDDEISNVKEEIINDTPTSIEEKKLELKQVVFEPIQVDNNMEVNEITTPDLSNEEMKEMFVDESIQEEISTIEPTEEEESQNFSTIEPNPENIFQNEEDGWTEELEQQFWDEQVPEPFATPEEIELQTIVTATPVVPNEEVEKKNS
jgi:hypothetical protein